MKIKGVRKEFSITNPFLFYLLRFSQEHAVFCNVCIFRKIEYINTYNMLPSKQLGRFSVFIYHNYTSCFLFLEYVFCSVWCNKDVFVSYIEYDKLFYFIARKHLKDDVFILCVSFFFIYFCIFFF